LLWLIWSKRSSKATYHTCIDTFNERCTLAQRGHTKQKRSDLRQVGLALLADAADQLPLFHDVYPGNRNDVTECATIAGEMAQRLRTLCDECEGIPLIMDKGQISTDNLATLGRCDNVHFISALVPSNHPVLLAVPLRR